MPPAGIAASQPSMFEDTPSWQRDPAITGLILFFMLISPIGAPLLGIITMAMCDMSREGAYQCIVPFPLFTYFMVFLWGPFFFLGLFAVAWHAISVGLLIRFSWFFLAAVMDALAER